MTEPNIRTNPYPGPVSFQIGETLYGRPRETRQLLNLLIAERIVLLYSPSGAGKTSLIQAALIPELAREGFRVFRPARVSLGAEEQVSGIANRYIFSLLLSWEAHLPDALAPLPHSDLAAMTLAEYLALRTPHRAPAPDEPADAPVAEEPWANEWHGDVLIFDQFEEILTVDPTDRDAKHEFFRQVGEVLQDRQRWALFAMREEFLAGLDPYLRAIPTRFATTFRLELLGPDAARQAMQRPAAAQGVTFTDTAADKLINDLRTVQVMETDGSTHAALGDFVEPVQLQVVCLRLWQGLAANDDEIGVDDVDAFGDVDSALRAYYTETVDRVALATDVGGRLLREWVNAQLITESGIRGQVLMGQNRTVGLQNVAIWQLVDAHLLRAEKRRGATWFELAHDRLLAPVQGENEAWFAHNLSPFQRQAAAWDRAGRLEGLVLHGAELYALIQQFPTLPKGWTETEEAFYAACRAAWARTEQDARQRRRIRIFGYLSIGLTAIALMALVSSIYLARQGRQLRNEGDRANYDAHIQSERADVQSRIALAQVLASTAPELLTERFKQKELARLLAAEAVRINPDEGRNIHWLLDRALRDVLGQSLVTIVDVGDNVSSIAVSPDGLSIFAAAGSVIYQWRLDDIGRKPRAFVGHQSWVTSIAISPDNSVLASASADNTFRIWNINLGEESAIFQGHTDSVSSISFSPDGSRIASASWDRSARLWDVRTGQQLATLLGHTEAAVWAVNFSPDGATLVTAGEDGTIRLWNPLTGELLATFEGDSSFSSAAFSPDGHWLATGGSDFNIVLWDVQTLQPLNSLPCHLSDITSVAFGNSGEKLASASSDNSICIWDMTNLAAPPFAFTGHENRTNSVAFSPDMTRLISGSSDGTVRIWTIDLNEMAATACQQAGRNMTEAEWNRYLPDTPHRPTCSPMEIGTGLAQAGNMISATIKFEEALRLDPQLSIVPEVYARQLFAPTLVEEGRDMARIGEVLSATLKFTEALALDPGLDIVPIQELKDFAVPALIEQGQKLARIGEIIHATQKFEEAVNLDLELDLKPEQEARRLVPQAITIGTPVTSTTEIHSRWYFTAIAGQMVTISLVDTEEGNFDPYLTLIGPNGETLIEDDDSGGGHDGYDALIQEVTLPEAGNYIIIAGREGSSAAYKLTVTEITNEIVTARALVAEGERMAAMGEVAHAITLFAQAYALDPTLASLPDPVVAARAATFLAVVETIANLVAADDDATVLAHIELALELGQFHLTDAALAWDQLCWWGSLYGFAAQVVNGACAWAVADATPQDNVAAYRDSRGLARALTGDIEGALEDFRFFIEASGGDVALREEWIARLEAGEEPAVIFDAATLDALKRE